MKIPKEISKDEIISRIILSPKSINKNNELKNSIYKPRSNKDEVSVMRFNYTTEEHIIEKSKSIRLENQKFVGYTMIVTEDIINANNIIGESSKYFKNSDGEKDIYRVELHYSPSRSDNSHSHLLFYYDFIEDEPLPPQISLIVQELIEKSKLVLLSDKA